MLGGNGIVSDNHVMRAFCDIEAIYTYEGSYDINSLVAGRELTGYSAFKWIVIYLIRYNFVFYLAYNLK